MSNQIKITKENLEKLMTENSTDLPLDEIEALMDAELEKPVEIMDTDLIDMCTDILSKAYNLDYDAGKPAEIYLPWEDKSENTAAAKPNKKKPVKLKQILLIAAAIVLVVIVALPVGAKLLNGKASGGIIGFYSNFFKINLKNEEASTDAPADDTVDKMIVSNLDEFILPEVLRGEEYEKTARLTQEDYMTTFYVSVVNKAKNISGSIIITQFKNADHNMTNGHGNVSDKHRNFKQLTIEGKEVIVFGRDGQSYIHYSDGTTNYEISLDCDFDTMVKIAETINVKG